MILYTKNATMGDKSIPPNDGMNRRNIEKYGSTNFPNNMPIFEYRKFGIQDMRIQAIIMYE